MKQTDKRKGPNTKDKSRSAGPNTRDHKLQEKKASRNLKQEEIDAKTSSYKLKNNMVGSNLKIGAEPSEAFENVVIDYVDDAYKTEEAVNNSRTVKMDEIQCNEKLSDNSSDMDIVDESDAETTNDSVSSHGDSQTADEDKAEKVTQVKSDSGADSNSQAERSKSDGKTNNQHAKAPKTPNKGSSKGLSKSSVMSSADNLKNMKVHPKPPSDSSEEADGQPPNEQDNRVGSLGEASSGAHEVSSDDKAVSTENNDRQEDNTSLDQKIEEMETRIKNLESELREVAALEISIYSVVPEHSSSAHKVHTPARRLSRLYIYACKNWSQDKRATVARNTISGLVIVSKSCGNDVSRLTFWLSNTVVLREIISQAFGSSCHSSSLAKVFESSGGEIKTSASKARNSGSRQLNKQGFLQFVDDWQETRTFTAALEKVESWMFARIVESIWWQTLTPNMQSPLGNSAVVEGSERLLGPALGDQKQGSFSINLWKRAFHEALKRLCPVRAGGHECGCLPVLARKVMEQCLGRLDVAMFNAILRESAHEIPTDPVSDPIVDSKVLPVPAGYLSFGSGAQLKNSVGNWTRWLSDFIGTNIDSSAKDENKTLDDDDIRGIEEPKSFPLLNGLSDLLMLPKDMLMDRTVRMEVCPSISLTLVKRILCNFSPDEFCPDPVPGAVLEALNAECIIEHRLSGDSTITFPYTAAPTVYKPPSSSDVAEKVAEAGGIHQLSRSASAVQRKGYTSDEELDELKYCLYSVIHRLPSSPTAHVSGDQQDGEGYDEGSARYDLLREVWQYT